MRGCLCWSHAAATLSRGLLPKTIIVLTAFCAADEIPVRYVIGGRSEIYENLTNASLAMFMSLGVLVKTRVIYHEQTRMQEPNLLA